MGKVKWGDNNPRVKTSEQYWKQPLKWNKEAEGAKVRPRVFCASLADWLDVRSPEDWLCDLLKLIHSTPNLDWLLLTKRPELFIARMHHALECDSWDGKNTYIFQWIKHIKIHDNIWIGTSVENQEMADKRIPELLKIPAKVHFLSCEPLLDNVNLSKWIDCGPLARMGVPPVPDVLRGPKIDWVIVGGESGPNARKMLPLWVSNLWQQCKWGKVPFFFKQWGGVKPKSNGRLLGGVEYNEFPNPTANYPI